MDGSRPSSTASRRTPPIWPSTSQQERDGESEPESKPRVAGRVVTRVIRARIGVLVPAGNLTVEPELYRMAPPGVTIHFARLDSGAGSPGTPEAMERRTLGYLDSIPLALRSLVDVRPAVIVLAHTAVSYLKAMALPTMPVPRTAIRMMGLLSELAGTPSRPFPRLPNVR
jgi:hypothetical protein